MRASRSAPASTDLRHALRDLAAAITGTPVRTIRVEYHYPAIIFSDGAYEEQRGDEAGTIGGVVLDPWTRQYHWYAMAVSPLALAALRRSSENPIVTIELVAIQVGLFLFSAILAERPIIGFVDNEPGRHAIIRGTSGPVEAASVVQEICDLEIAHKLLCYWARVPSPSNLADDPSRGITPAPLPGWPAPQRALCSSFSSSFSTMTGRVKWGLRDLSTV